MKQSIKPVVRRSFVNMGVGCGSKNKFTFAKASRFPVQQENDDPQMVVLPSTLSKKSCTFGLGQRKPLISSHCRDSPSEESFLLQSSFNSTNHSLDYKRQKIKERELFYIKPIPGPGSYNPGTPRKRRVPSCIISKTKKSQSLSSTPNASRYNPNYEYSKRNVAVNFSFSRTRKLSFIDEKIEQSSDDESFFKQAKKCRKRTRSVDLTKIWRGKSNLNS